VTQKLGRLRLLELIDKAQRNTMLMKLNVLPLFSLVVAVSLSPVFHTFRFYHAALSFYYALIHKTDFK